MFERLFRRGASDPASAERALLEAELSHDDIRNQLAAALRAEKQAAGLGSSYLYPREVYDDYLVYSVESPAGDKLFKRSYTIDDTGKVTLGDDSAEVKAETVYTPLVTPATESAPPPAATLEEAQLTGDVIPLVEKSMRRDGTVPVKIIQPGWGSSGYYSDSLLERDGPKVFTKGLKMYWNHPTAAEEADRPERDLRDLAAELVGDARYEAAGAAGAGLYADAKVFGGYKESVEELAPHIGVSIRAMGRAKQGEAEGKSGPVIESLVAAQSVDFVTTPGAGGQVLQLFEAAGRGRATTSHHAQEDPPVAELTEAQRAEMQEKDNEIGRLRSAAILREAHDIATATLAKVDGLPDFVRARLVEAVAGNPPVKDDKLDTAAFGTLIEKTAKAEIEYLAQVTGTGQVRGMGSAGDAGSVNAQEAEQQLTSAFTRLGLSESAAKQAAAGRSH